MLRTLACYLLLVGGLLTHLPPAAAEPGLGYIEQLPAGIGWRVIDSRPLAQCERRSLAGARCLSAGQLLAGHGRLPSLRDITWLLGTLGLTGKEPVVVAGGDAMERDFIAGMLYLAGQRRVAILRTPLARLLAAEGATTTPGQRRSMSREVQFTARPRAERIVLRRELWQRLRQAESPRLLDARAEAEYWGERIRGFRGGHIPGAEHWPMQDATALRDTAPGRMSVIYGHSALDSVAAFVRLQSVTNRPVQLLIGGWREWAADGTLPVDAESYNDKTAPVES